MKGVHVYVFEKDVPDINPGSELHKRAQEMFAESGTADAAKFRAAAKKQSSEGELEVDDDALISTAREHGGDDGAYVMAWLWVNSEEAGVAPVLPAWQGHVYGKASPDAIQVFLTTATVRAKTQGKARKLLAQAGQAIQPDWEIFNIDIFSKPETGVDDE